MYKEIVADLKTKINRLQRKEVKIMEIKTGEEILQMELETQKFLVDQILPVGLSLLAGSPKIGKSWFVLQLGIAISNGLDFLGFKTLQSSVWYLCLEDTYQRIQNRLIDYEDLPLDNIVFSPEAKSLNRGLIKQLEDYIAISKNTKLIIIDTLQRIRSSNTDGYTYGQDYNEINILNDFVNRTGISILVVHHLRKMKSENPFEEISGTTGIAGAVDGMYVMKRNQENKSEAKLIATGRDFESFDLKITFNDESHQWELLEKSLEDIIEDESVLHVIKLMNTLNNFNGTATDLSQLLDTECDYKILPSTLSRKLNKNKQVLKEHNIEFTTLRTRYQRTISLKKKVVVRDDNDGSDGYYQ